MAIISDNNSEYVAHVGGRGGGRYLFKEFIYHGFYFLLHMCATNSELPSNNSILVYIGSDLLR